MICRLRIRKPVHHSRSCGVDRARRTESGTTTILCATRFACLFASRCGCGAPDCQVSKANPGMHAGLFLRAGEELKALKSSGWLNSTADAARYGSSPSEGAQTSILSPTVRPQNAFARARDQPSQPCSRPRSPAEAEARRAAPAYPRTRRVCPQKAWSPSFPKQPLPGLEACDPLASVYCDPSRSARRVSPGSLNCEARLLAVHQPQITLPVDSFC